MEIGASAAPSDVYVIDRSPGPVPVWAPGGTSVTGAPVTDTPRTATPGTVPVGASRIARRPRSGLIVALFVFYCLQLAAAVVAWREAPIRTGALVDPMLAYGLCAALVVPAFLLRGRWRVVPILLATAAGTVAPVLLARDLMEVVGPRDVWVGQSLTLQVLFPLVVGVATLIALLSAPRRVAAHWETTERVP